MRCDLACCITTVDGVVAPPAPSTRALGLPAWRRQLGVGLCISLLVHTGAGPAGGEGRGAGRLQRAVRLAEAEAGAPVPAAVRVPFVQQCARLCTQRHGCAATEMSVALQAHVF
jgi:hypothetical protein